MSIQHVSAVLDCRDPRLAGCRKLVLVTLANRTDEEGRCWPSQELLAGECGISVRALSDHLKGLEDDGFITRDTQHRGRGNGSRTIYNLHLQALKFAPEKNAPAEIAPANSVECTGSPPRVKKNLQEPTAASSADSRVNAMDRILKACGPGMLDPAKSASPMLDLRARIGRWLEAWSLEADILPVVEARTRDRRQRPMSHFAFIEEDIAAFHAKRTATNHIVEITHGRHERSSPAGGYAGPRGRGPAKDLIGDALAHLGGQPVDADIIEHTGPVRSRASA